jgi:hypothetical protein
VAGDAEQPVPEPALAGVESIESLDGQQPDLLVDVLGDVTIAADEVVDQPEDVTDVPLVHHIPRGSIAPGHRPDEADFVVHLPVASVGLG